MPDPDSIAAQVARNCAVTDARHASMFSVCQLALRLRGLYKWEKGLEPWVEEAPDRLLRWIEETENAWEGLENREYGPIRLQGQAFEPFDVTGINRILEPAGMVYGAGLSQGLAPTFFLAVLKETRKILGCRIFITGKELARDLMSIPAFSQEDCIYVRTEMVKAFLWDLIFFVNRSGKKALDLAMESFQVKKGDVLSLKTRFSEIVESETETFLFHELGEILDPTLDRIAWRKLLAAFPHTVIELFSRSLKDILADTSPLGRLSFIVKEQRIGSLALFMASWNGLRKSLFPEMAGAFERFVDERNWDHIAETVRVGYENARDKAVRLMDIFLSDQEKKDLSRTEKEIHRVLIQPLKSG